MQKKLTITLNEEVYNGLHKVVGRRRISRFIESRISKLSGADMQKVERAVQVQLSLSNAINDPSC